MHLRTGIAAACLTLLGGCGPPAPVPLPRDQSAFQRVLNTLLFFPEKTCEQLRRDFDVPFLPIVETPDQAGLTYREVWLLASDRVPLRVWYLPARLDRGTVIFSMGAVGSMSCYLFHTRMLVHDGWSVVMYDYRGFGGSSGTPDVAFLASDLNTVLDWTLWFTGRDQVTLMSVSLGSIPTIAVAAQRPENVNALVLDSPMALTQTIRRLGFVLRERTESFTDLLQGTLASEQLMEQITQPTLILVGDRDDVTGVEAADLLSRNAGTVVQQVLFKGIGHARAVFRQTDRYRYEVERFLTRVWNQQATQATLSDAALEIVPQSAQKAQQRPAPDGNTP